MGFTVDTDTAGTGRPSSPGHIGSLIADAGLSGRSLEHGLLRFHDSRSARAVQIHVGRAFPGLIDQQATLVAFDWRGRQIMATSGGRRGTVPLVLADVGTGRVDRLTTVGTFMAEISAGDLLREVLEEQTFIAWRRVAGHSGSLTFDTCVEYSIPLYLGGAAAMSNMAMVPVDSSWRAGRDLLTRWRDRRAQEIPARSRHQA